MATKTIANYKIASGYDSQNKRVFSLFLKTDSNVTAELLVINRHTMLCISAAYVVVWLTGWI